MKNIDLAGPFLRVAAVTSIAAILGVTGCSRPKSEGPSAGLDAAGNVTLTAQQRDHIRLLTVQPASFRKSIDTNGIVDFDNDQATSVLAPFSGPVSRILVSLGQHVKKGEPLAIADSPDFAAAVSAYRKAIATAVTNRHLADLDKDLLQHQGVAQREAAQAETDAVNAEADRDAALQGLISLNVAADTIKDIQAGRPTPHLEGTIRAPIAGIVAEKLVTPGQLLEGGSTPTFTIADLSRVWVFAQLFGADPSAVEIGDGADVESGTGDRQLSGTVDNIAASVDPDTRSVAARVVVENPGDLLKKQMYVHVRIHARQDSSGLLVPVSSILRDDENLPFVYLVRPDGSFARARVTVGYRSADRYEIVDGLKPGDQIVVDGSLFVQFIQNQ